MLAAIAATTAGCAASRRTGRRGVAARHRRAARRRCSFVGGAIADVAMGMWPARCYPLRRHRSSKRIRLQRPRVLRVRAKRGYRVPRTSQELFGAARKIAVNDADPGDLMFFQDQTKLSHVGIYLGDGLFVHAPASGQNVAVASLGTQPYYQAAPRRGRTATAALTTGGRLQRRHPRCGLQRCGSSAPPPSHIRKPIAPHARLAAHAEPLLDRAAPSRAR